jgi:heme oxygenase
MTTRFELKAATDDIHRELDQKLSRLNLGKTEDYRRFLGFQARTVPSLEAALASGGLGCLVEGWSDTRRSADIEADLAALGEAMPPAAPVPAIDGTAEILGAAYVLEGSRLGGRLLRQRVAEGLPARFLSGDGSLSPWPALLAVLERFLHSEDLLGEAKSAARRSFAWFVQVADEAGI